MATASPLCCLLHSLSLNVLSVCSSLFSIMPKDQQGTQSLSHSVSPGQRNHWFSACVSSYICLSLKVLLLVVAGENNSQEHLSTLRSPQQADSAAGCQCALEPLLRQVCSVAKLFRVKRSVSCGSAKEVSGGSRNP